MPVFDQELGRVVVRIVYDGPGMAGKTTNVQKLSTIFSLSKRSELDSPEQTAGRTTYFDWLSMDSGLVQGHPLRTEFVTVPGQRVLARRRLALIDQADAIVFVVDGRPGRLAESVQMLSVLRAHLAKTSREECPIVYQINKQDVPGALGLVEARRGLDLDDDACMVGAQASLDMGVRESAVLAIRRAVNAAQDLILRGGIESISGKCGSALRLKEHLEELEKGFVLTPAEILRQESSEIKVTVVRSGPEREKREGGGAALPATPPIETVPPVLPTSDVEVGCVWPPTLGRDYLRKLDEMRKCEAPLALGPASAGVFRFRVGEVSLKTAKENCTQGLDAARKALVAAARARLHLGDLLVEPTVLCVTREASGGFWLWTVGPSLPTLDDDLTQALAKLSEKGLETVVLCFIDCIVRVALLAAQQGVALRPGLDAFARQGEALRYVAEEISLGAPVPTLLESILEIPRRCASYPQIVENYVDSLGATLERELSAEQLQSLGLSHSLRAKLAPTDVMSAARTRLLGRLGLGSSV